MGHPPEAVQFPPPEAEHSLIVVPLIAASHDCSQRLPNGQAAAINASAGLPFGRRALRSGPRPTGLWKPKSRAGWAMPTLRTPLLKAPFQTARRRRSSWPLSSIQRRSRRQSRRRGSCCSLWSTKVIPVKPERSNYDVPLFSSLQLFLEISCFLVRSLLPVCHRRPAGVFQRRARP